MNNKEFEERLDEVVEEVEIESGSEENQSSTTVTDLAPQALRCIWTMQLARKEERVVHGHFEGELAHHLRTLFPLAS
jgi:hypothetical protein